MCDENLKESMSLFKDNYRNYEKQGNLIEDNLKKNLNFNDLEPTLENRSTLLLDLVTTKTVRHFKINLVTVNV